MKLFRSILVCLFLLMALSTNALAAPLSQTSTIYYVKSIPTGPNCTSWDDACGLQAALTKATAGSQIWVAKGTYYPTTSSDRSATFRLKSGVGIFGGFPENGGAWIERNWVTNVTTLSGDIGEPAANGDNSYHVVTAANVAASAILDGFTISAGNANGLSSLDQDGGGMVNTDGSPTLSNLTISSNSATRNGGGISNTGDPILTDVTISGNNVTNGNGGGMRNYFGDPTLTNVTINGNSAKYGGGIHNHSSDAILTNVTINNNSASYGGGMYNFNSRPTLSNVTISSNNIGIWNYNNSNPILINSIVWGHSYQIYNEHSSGFPDSFATITYSDIQGGHAGIGNLNSDPKLGSLAENGGFTKTMALTVGSPAIDKANPASCPIFDQRGYPRPIDGDAISEAICDMGAYEYASAPARFTLKVDKVGNGSVTASPNEAGYLYGQPVTLTATAEPRNTFTGWSGDASGTANPLNFTILGNTNITATFIQDKYTLGVALVGSGTVTKDPDQPTYHYGDVVTLTPTAATGWTFKDWTGATVTDNKVTINGNTSITATFTQDEYTLDVTLVGSGTVTKAPPQTTYHYGDVVTLTPTAATGWTFKDWTGATVTDNKVTINGNTSLTATFTKTLFKIYLPSVLK